MRPERGGGWLAGLLVPLAVMVSAPAGAGAATLPENPIGGSAVFVEKACIQCHAIQGYGGTEGPDLGRLELKGGFLGMAGFMWNHAPKMLSAFVRAKQPFPKFSTEEMTQLVAFLYTLNYLDPPGDPRRGEEIFAARGCLSCHSIGGAGGEVGPPLEKYGNRISPLFVATSLWNKGPAMAAAMEERGIRRPVLSGRDVRDIIAFIRARAIRKPEEPSRILLRPGNPKNGARLFASKGCAGCHALHGRQRGSAPALGSENLKVSFSAIASRMWNHGPGMWASWKVKGLAPITFTVGEMADVTAYLYFLQFESPPGDPARGASLFKSRGCGGCHAPTSPGAKGKGPDLRTKGPWKSGIDLAREMWNHAGKMYERLLQTPREWPKLSEREVSDLLAYIQTLGKSPGKKEVKP